MTELQQSREFVIEARRVAVNYGKNVGSVRPNLIRWGRGGIGAALIQTRERLRFLSTYNYDPLSRPAFRLSLASDFNFCLPLFGHVLPLIEKITPELYHTIQSSPPSVSAINYGWLPIKAFSVTS